jgi:hypothetical protein
MAISKSELENLIYIKRSIGQSNGVSVPQPSTSEKTEVNNIVDELLGYILAKHS